MQYSGYQSPGQPPPGQPPPMVASPPGAGPGPTVVIMQQYPAAKPPRRQYTHYKSSCAVILGTMQIILTVVMIITVAMVMVYDIRTNTYEWIPFAGIIACIIGGISAVFFFITGGINICSGKFKSTCLIITTLVLCILCLVMFCTAWFGNSIAWLIVYDGYENTGVKTSLAVSLVTCIIFMIVTLASSIIVCMALCKGSSVVEDGQTVQYQQGQIQQYQQGPGVQGVTLRGCRGQGYPGAQAPPPYNYPQKQ